jgi:acyl carrier protein
MSQASENSPSKVSQATHQQKPRAAEILQAWLTSRLANLLGLSLDEVDVAVPFDRYGLDSQSAIVLSGDLQDWLDCDLDPVLLFDYPTIEAVSTYLA